MDEAIGASRPTALFLVPLLLAGILAACSSSTPTGPTSSGGSGGGGGGGGGSEATASVTIGDNFFSPATVTVTRGSSGATVAWTWAGSNPHSVTFDAGGPNSIVQNSGSFSRTFTASGTFTYYCTVHGRAIMSGTVVVQ